MYDLVGKKVRFYTRTGMVAMKVTRVNYPTAKGLRIDDSYSYPEMLRDSVSVDLREVTEVKVHKVDWVTPCATVFLISYMFLEGLGAGFH